MPVDLCAAERALSTLGGETRMTGRAYGVIRRAQRNPR